MPNLQPSTILLARGVLVLLFGVTTASVAHWLGMAAPLVVAASVAGALVGTWLWRHTVATELQNQQKQITALTRQNTLLQAYIDNAPVVMALKDARGHYISCNAAFTHLHHVPSADLAGKQDHELGIMGDATATAIRNYDLQVLKNRKALTYQVPVMSQTTPRQMEAFKFPLIGREGELLGIGLLSHDVTDREVMTEKFERVFQVSPDWIVITRLSDGVVIDANLGFERLSGHAREDAIGLPIGRLGIWAEPSERSTIVKDLLDTGLVVNACAKMHHKGGEVRDFMVNAALISLEGQNNSHAVWIARDVTDASRAEQALRESEARFSSLFEMSPLPTSYSFDSDNFTVNYRNAAFYEAFGYRKDEVAQKSTQEIGFWVDPQDGIKARQIRDNRQPVDNWVAQVRHADGHTLWVSIYGRFIVEPHRTIVVTTLFDITEQRRAQQEVENLNSRLEDRVLERTEQLQVANAELSHALSTIEQARDSLVQSEKLASLGALVAGVAHELNTPIGNGLTVASAMDERTRNFQTAILRPLKRSELLHFVTETQFAADLLVRSLTRAASLVASFKQVAVDQTSSQRREFDLGVLLDEVVITMSPSTRRAKCEVTLSVEPGLKLDSFPGPLIQVLSNLINNAVVHAFENSDHGRIDIHAARVGESEVQIKVRDNGCGIDPTHVKRIYDPFFTTRLGQGGSGLGLHIVHNIVTGILGGRIDVLTALGSGTEFKVQLPLTAPKSAEDAP
jgi:PAS domain S-box-containing protein